MFNSFSFSFWILNVFGNSYFLHMESNWQIVYTIEFLKWKITCMWNSRSFWDDKLIWHLWNYLPFNLWEFNSHLYKMEFKVLCVSKFLVMNISIMKLLWSFGNRKFWRFILGCRGICGQFFCTKHLVVQHCVGKSYFLCLINGGVLCHQWRQKIWIIVVIFVWTQKWRFVLHHLCMSTCVCLVAHVAC